MPVLVDEIRYIDYNSPVLVKQKEFVIDDTTSEARLRCQMVNLGEKKVTAVRLLLTNPTDSFNKALESSIEVPMLDFTATPGEEFGSNKLIPLLTMPSARHIDVEILSVAYADGSVWERGDNPLVPVSERQIPEQETLSKLRAVAGQDAFSLAQDKGHYWVCVCGHFNPATRDKCSRCHREKAAVLRDYSIAEDVETAFSQYEEKQEEIKAQVAAKATRRKKYITMVAIVAVAIVAGVFGWGKYNEMQEIKLAEEHTAMIKEQADASPEILKELINDSNIGDIVYYGRYEQDNDTANGKEPIAWRVLAVEGNKKLVISEKCLDYQPYNTEYADITWEECTLRSWLNDEFINTAFTRGQQKAIAMSQLCNEDNPEYGTPGGNDTQDKVFLLSIAEAEKCFASDEARSAKITPYADAQGGAYTIVERIGWWWLRSPGYDAGGAAFVLDDGSFLSHGFDVDYVLNALRPALWLDL